MSSPRQRYEPDVDYTPFDRYQSAAQRGLAAARNELAASAERADAATIGPNPKEGTDGQ